MAAESKPSEHERNLAAYNQRRAELEAEHRGEYVAVAGGRIVGIYPDFKTAWAVVEQVPSALAFEIGMEPDIAPIRVLPGRRLGNLVD